MSLQTYSTFEEYKQTFFPKEKGELLSSTPEEFGQALAERHIEIVREAVQEWLQGNITTDTDKAKDKSNTHTNEG
jgi:hypothetical protein